MINQQLHCALVEVRDGVNCAPFSALPFYKGYQQTVFGSLEDLSEHLEHGPKIRRLLRKFAQAESESFTLYYRDILMFD